MARGTAVVLASTLLLGLLAGCTSGSERTAEDAAKEPSPSLPGEGGGTLAGFVLDDALNPLEGVAVTNENTNATVSTDLTGAYAFEGLAPTVYRLRFDLRGFVGVLKRVNVVSSQTNWANVTLAALPRGEAHREEYDFQGFLECNHSLVPSPTGGYPPGNCVPSRLVALDTTPNSNTKQVFVFPAGRDAVEVLVEMVWEADDLPFAGKLRVVVEENGTSLQGGRTYMSYEGPSPARIELRPPVLDAVPVLLQTRTEVTEQEPGLAFQQPFTVYVTVFYVEPMPEDYSRIPEG